jgi:hypothetical protein
VYASASNVLGLGGATDANALASAVSTHDYHCDIVDWGQEYIPAINIDCTTMHGQYVRTPFTVQWVVP